MTEIKINRDNINQASNQLFELTQDVDGFPKTVSVNDRLIIFSDHRDVVYFIWGMDVIHDVLWIDDHSHSPNAGEEKAPDYWDANDFL